MSNHNGRPPAEVLDMLPPSAPNAEAAMLGSVLLSDDPAATADAVLAVVIPGDCYIERNRVVLDAVRRLRKRGVAPEAGLLLDELATIEPPAGSTWAAELAVLAQATPHAVDAERHAEIVRDKSQARQAIHGTTDAMRRLYLGESVGAVLGDLQERLPVTTPEPEPARVRPWAPFPTAELPEPVRDFVIQTSAALGCDESFLALPALAVLAAAIGTTRRIALKGSWPEPCILWTAIVAESGTVKSPAIDAAIEPLQREQDAALDEYETQIAEHAKALIFHEAGMRQWKNAANKSGNAGDPPEPPAEPKPRRCVVSDTTIECLAERLHANPRGVLAYYDELGTFFGGFGRYKKGGSGDESHWLTLYGARPLTIDRKANGQRPIRVRHAGVSICGAIPPAPLARALGAEFFESGGVARFLLASPPPKLKRWHNRTPPAATLRAWDLLVRELLLLDFADDKDGRPAPVDVSLSSDARAIWQPWFDAHAGKLHDATGDLAAMLSKNEGVAARLALIVHLARVTVGDAAPEAVDAVSMQTGCNLADWFAYEAERIYAVLRPKAGGDERRELITWISQRGGQTTARELQHGNRRYPTADAAEQALDGLARGNIGVWNNTPAGPKGGRPSRVFMLSTQLPSTKPRETPICGGSVDNGCVDAPETQNGESDTEGYLEI